MTLFVDQSGSPASVTLDLIAISASDGGYGETAVAGDTTVQQVTYAESAGQPAIADRLNLLVNTDFGPPIVITGLQGGVDPVSGQTITGNGLTYVDSANPAQRVIRVVYDLSQCLGEGIEVFDVDGNVISFPNSVLLYHELSHALRAANGTTQPNDEIPAETDENVMRTQYGYCLRDVNNHGGGCGAGNSCGGSVTDSTPGALTGGGSISCFIVSAATAADSTSVAFLRAIRDHVVPAVPLGHLFFEAVYQDYYQTGPLAAAALRADPDTRAQADTLIVQPLLAWYGLAERLLFGDGDDIERACGDLAAVSRNTPLGATTAADFRRLLAGESLSGDAENALRLLATAGAGLAVRPFTRWAVLEPVAASWETRGDPAACRASVEAWYGRAPLDLLPEPAEHDLAAALDALAASPLLENLALRQTVGGRLHAAWPQRRDLLRRHGFDPKGE